MERFRDHEAKLIEDTFRMIQESLEEMLSDLSDRLGISEESASQLLSQYRTDILKVMEMPHGGSLTPEDFAEMVIVQHMKSMSQISNDEAAATASI